jgi:chromosome segregation ATPase
MDKIIGTINNNLRSVIEGIRQHLSDSEALFEEIKADMDKKVNQAANYKEQVTESKEKINKIEDEIEKLEKDLNDLNDKFGGTDFKEILQAGNKEINTKIIEKRAVIQKESQRILDLTDKARKIKDALIDLREKKYALSEDIKETRIVEKFYSEKVNEIIDFVEAGNDIELAVDNSPESELYTDN